MTHRESVWDYPRPPKIARCSDPVAVKFAHALIAKTSNALRVLETSHPPVYYIPPTDIRMEFIEPAAGRSHCEYKGEATYVTIVANGKKSERAGWLYKQPTPPYLKLKGHIAFYASRVDEARVGNDIVIPQPGDFYGGWITANLDGPFKGVAGSSGW